MKSWSYKILCNKHSFTLTFVKITHKVQMERARSFWNHINKMYSPSKFHNKIPSTHWILALHTHPTKLKLPLLWGEKGRPFCLFTKITTCPSLCHMVSTTHWLIPIGLFHHNLFFILIYPSIFTNTPPWGEIGRLLCILTKVNICLSLSHMGSN